MSQNGYIHDHQITIVMNLIETQIAEREEDREDPVGVSMVSSRTRLVTRPSACARARARERETRDMREKERKSQR